MADMTRTVNPGGGADHTTIDAALEYIITNWSPSGSDKAYVDVTGNDTTAISIAAAPTGQTASNPITVRPASGQQHAGTYNTGKARMTVGSPGYQTGIVRVTGSPALWLTFQYMQFENTAASTAIPVIADITLGTSGKVLFDGCLLRFTGTSMPTYPGDDSAALLSRGTSTGSEIELRNCIMWNGNRSYWRSYSDTPTTARFRNCTIYKFVAGNGDSVLDTPNHAGGTLDFTNTFAQSDLPNTDDMLYGAVSSGTIITTGLATSDATSPNVPLRSLIASFVNAGSFDLHLLDSDTALLAKGTNMSGTYTNDIDGSTFATRNSVGADDLVPYNPPVLPYIYTEFKSAV